MKATLTWKGQSTDISALIDSGADESFLDTNVAKQLGLPVLSLDEPLVAYALDGRLLARVTCKTAPVGLLLSSNHQEEISFFVTNSPHVPIVLGHPWLVKHNPQIDWAAAKIVS